MIKEYTFRGHPYRFYYVETFAGHPSWASFDDEASVRDVKWDIQKGDLILDVGACYGSYALPALACGAAHVYAWSPQTQGAMVGVASETPDAAIFAESLRLNDWSSRCTLYKTGLYSKKGWVDSHTMAFSESRPEKLSPNDIEVDTLDAWFAAAPTEPSLRERWKMKIDVEGVEVEVLRGGTNLIKTLRPVLLVENHLFKRASIEQEVRDLVTSWGYREIDTTPYGSVSHSLYYP